MADSFVSFLSDIDLPGVEPAKVLALLGGLGADCPDPEAMVVDDRLCLAWDFGNGANFSVDLASEGLMDCFWRPSRAHAWASWEDIPATELPAGFVLNFPGAP